MSNDQGDGGWFADHSNGCGKFCETCRTEAEFSGDIERPQNNTQFRISEAVLAAIEMADSASTVAQVNSIVNAATSDIVGIINDALDDPELIYVIEGELIEQGADTDVPAMLEALRWKAFIAHDEDDEV